MHVYLFIETPLIYIIEIRTSATHIRAFHTVSCVLTLHVYLITSMPHTDYYRHAIQMTSFRLRFVFLAHRPHTHSTWHRCNAVLCVFLLVYAARQHVHQYAGYGQSLRREWNADRGTGRKFEKGLFVGPKFVQLVYRFNVMIYANRYRLFIVWSALRLVTDRSKSAAGRLLLGLCAHLNSDRNTVRKVRRQRCGHVYFWHLRAIDSSDAGASTVSGMADVLDALSDRLRFGMLCYAVNGYGFHQDV